MTKINIENAEIKTVSIEVKTLTLNGKQITLSVFKQIPLEGILKIDLDNTLLFLDGNCWGRINYFWNVDKNFNPERYVHLLWQKENELRRDIFAKDKQDIRAYLNHHFFDNKEKEKIVTELMTKYNEIFLPILELPQLFIAV